MRIQLRSFPGLRTFLIASISILVTVTGLPRSVDAIVVGQVDDFEDATTMGWRHGATNPNMPVNIATGGPAGAGDAFVRVSSNGTGTGPGSRLLMFNLLQWTGNYVTAGVQAVQADVVNLGPTTLHLRFMCTDLLTTTFVSANAHVIPPDGQWRRIVFNLVEPDFASLFGPLSLADLLAVVTHARILSSTTLQDTGDSIVATLGADNITALDKPIGVEAATWSSVKALFD